jgi:hypothetical protein
MLAVPAKSRTECVVWLNDLAILIHGCKLLLFWEKAFTYSQNISGLAA